MSGSEIVALIENWAISKGIDPDEFDLWIASEFFELMEEDD